MPKSQNEKAGQYQMVPDPENEGKMITRKTLRERAYKRELVTDPDDPTKMVVRKTLQKRVKANRGKVTIPQTDAAEITSDYPEVDLTSEVLCESSASQSTMSSTALMNDYFMPQDETISFTGQNEAVPLQDTLFDIQTGTGNRNVLFAAFEPDNTYPEIGYLDSLEVLCKQYGMDLELVDPLASYTFDSQNNPDNTYPEIGYLDSLEVLCKQYGMELELVDPLAFYTFYSQTDPDLQINEDQIDARSFNFNR